MSEPDEDFDYGEDARSPLIGDNLKKALTDCADKQEKLEEEILLLQSQIENKTAALRELAEKTIPNLLDGMNGSLKLDDGRVIEINQKIRASIAGEKSEPAIEWLDKNGHGNIVKRQFVIEFNRDDEAWAKKFEMDLRKRKKPLNVKRKHSVHPQTLEAFVREQLGSGTELPVQTFGIYRQRISKITRPDLDTKPRKSRKQGGDTPDF